MTRTSRKSHDILQVFVAHRINLPSLHHSMWFCYALRTGKSAEVVGIPIRAVLAVVVAMVDLGAVCACLGNDLVFCKW